MSYRVTNSMMQTLMLNDMHYNMNKMLEINQQMSTQRKYNSASENPNAVTKGMGLETMIFENSQYKSNLQDAGSWLKFTDDALMQLNDAFQRVRELTIYAGDGTLEGIDHTAIAEELVQLKEQMRGFANSTIGGEYLFSGLKTCKEPFGIGKDGEVIYSGNDRKLVWEFGRAQTGNVSLSGRDVFPLDETVNSLKGTEQPLDFRWKGRGEILEFKVGWRTVKVRIPEDWEDETRNGVSDPTDFNRFRDPGEKLDGHSLDDIARLINSSKEMGDVSKLLTATVVKDNDRGVQYLKIQSHTGEPVRLTGWPETDTLPAAEGIKGAAYGAVGRTLTGDGRLDLRFGDNFTYSVDLAGGTNLRDAAAKLNAVPEGKVWASYKTDGTNEWIDFVARKPGDSFTMDARGGAAALFAPERVKVSSLQSGAAARLTGKAFDTTDTFAAITPGRITLTRGDDTWSLDIAVADDIAAVRAAINGIAGAPFAAAIVGGALQITSAAGAFDVTAEGGAVPLFSDGVSASSSTEKDKNGKFTLDTGMVSPSFALGTGESALVFEYGGQKHWVDLAGSTTLASVATALNTALGAAIPGFNASVKTALDDKGNSSQYLSIETTDGAFKLSGFGDGADVVGRHGLKSLPIEKNKDHTHIGLAAMMGMETTVSSREYALNTNLGDTTAANNALHWNIKSGSRSAEIFINDNANLTVEELAKRINGICGDWLEAVVSTDSPDGTDPFADPLDNSEQNKEAATQKLLLKTIDGAPFAVYDGPGKTGYPAAKYAAAMGVGTALSGVAAGAVVYPAAAAGSAFDPKMPALLDVQVGEKTFQVKVCANKCGTAETVAAAIVKQVNDQYGSALLAWDPNDVQNTTDPNTFALYALTGEPMRVIDRGYGDPRFADYSGGIASQLGMAAGITTTTGVHMNNDVLAADGLMRISSQGHTIDIPVLAGENLHQIANRIRDYAGDWLDVSFTNSIIGGNGNVKMSLAAKDGAPVSVFDINGSAASTFGFGTALVGTANLLVWAPVADNTLTFTVNGASHTIDLWDNTANPEAPIVHSPEDLVNAINTRFQGMDIRAEILETKNNLGVVTAKRLALWSPKGYTFSVDAAPAGSTHAAVGIAEGTASAVRGGSGPFNQLVTHRTGNNRKQTDFFGVMDRLVATVRGGNVDGISDVMIGKLDNWMSTLLKDRAQVGALLNRYTSMESRLTSADTHYQELHSNTVGVDLAEVATNYQMAFSVYEASLAAIARIMQPTLLDFLR